MQNEDEKSNYYRYTMMFKEFKLSFCEQLRLLLNGCICMPCLTRRDRQIQKQLALGDDRLGKALDTRTIVKYQRVLITLLSLNLSKPA